MTAKMTSRLTITEHLAVVHLMSACTFSRKVGEIEAANMDGQLSSFFDEIYTYAVASVVMAVAGLEAYANEIYKYSKRNFPATNQDLLLKLWEMLERKSILEKFEFALALLDKPQMDSGGEPYQDVAAVIELRNGLVHFTPESSDEKHKHKRIHKWLEHKATRSAYFAGTGNTLFPHAWACHASTDWTVTSVLKFIQKFAELSGIPNNLSAFNERLVP